jgi:hypothetical protein
MVAVAERRARPKAERFDRPFLNVDAATCLHKMEPIQAG